MTTDTISRSELSEHLRALAKAVDPCPQLFGDDGPETRKIAPPLFRAERWQAIEDMAYAIDSEPSNEASWLWATREHFRGCDPNTDWPGYVVCHLLESLLVNRGHKLPRDRSTAVPHGPSNGNDIPF